MADKTTQVYAYYEYLRTVRNKAIRQVMGPAYDLMTVGDFRNRMMGEAERISREYRSGNIDAAEATQLQRKFMDIYNLVGEISSGPRSVQDANRNSDFHQLNAEMKRYEAVIRGQADMDSVDIPDLSDGDIQEIYNESSKYTKQNRQPNFMSPPGTPWDQRNAQEKQYISDQRRAADMVVSDAIDFYSNADIEDIRGTLDVDGFQALQSTYDTSEQDREYDAMQGYRSKYFGDQEAGAVSEPDAVEAAEEAAEDPEVSATVEEDPIPDTGVIDQEDYDRFKEQAEDPAVDPIETITEGGGVKIPDDFGELSNMMRDAGYEHFHVRHPDAMPYWTHKETGFDIQHTELREFLEAGGLQDPSVEEQWEADRDSGNRQPVFAMERQQVEWEEKQEKLRINREQREDPEFQIRQMIDGLNQAMEGDNHNYWLSQYDFNRDGSLSPADTLAITNAYNNGGMDEVNALTEAHGEWNLNQQREQTPQWDGDWTPGRSDAEGWSGPGPNDMTTQAVVEWVNPETGEMTSNNTGGWSPPPGSAWIRKDRYESLYGDIDNSRIIRPNLADLGVAPFPDEEVFVDENNTTSGLSPEESEQFLNQLQEAESLENMLDDVEVPSYGDVIDNYEQLHQTYESPSDELDVYQPTDVKDYEDQVLHGGGLPGEADESLVPDVDEIYDDIYDPTQFTGNIQGTESELGAINNFVSDYASGKYEDQVVPTEGGTSDGGLFNSNGILNTSDAANNNTGNNNKLVAPPSGLSPTDRLKWIQQNGGGQSSTGSQTSTNASSSAYDPSKWKPKLDTASVFKPIGSFTEKNNKLKSTTLKNSLLGN